MEIPRLFGLPAHPLLVHVPVVLIPLTALGAVVVMVSKRWRDRIGWVVAGIGAVAAVGAFLATSSGEALEEAVRETSVLGSHEELADLMWPIALGMVVLLIGALLFDRLVIDRRSVGAMAARPTWARPVATTLAVAVIVVAAFATFWVIRVGHTGAKAVWERTRIEQTV
jgi:xanthine/uracil permease